MLLSLLVGTASLFGQDYKVGIHMYNPLAYFQKTGFKVEYRYKTLGVLLGGIQYYGTTPRYPGSQGSLEGRYYWKNPNSAVGNEKFLQAKLFIGNQKFSPALGDGFFRTQEVPAGKYYGLGLGMGKHRSFGHFFLDVHAGLKVTISEVPQDRVFYTTGPASVLDLHFNIGFQF